ncbi:class I SAM-dependent methyltransferase [Streptomyces sp. NPDC048179]|uniref:class I SAM-dependent methyltransferase n=1 Tax=Streptomyces sp. NPDC048179 TaxID=3365506 RepID=UPI0037170251
MSPNTGYLLDNARPEAGTRFDALSELFDPDTFRRLDVLGVTQGWRCWEVGAGGPTVATWLADRVGPTGRVLATDIDTSWISAAEGGVLEVRRHDVGHDEPPEGEGFDLVHARFVLVHVPERDRALRVMADSLRPGGLLVVEDIDPALQPLVCPDEYGPEQALANKIWAAFHSVMASRGADLSYGRKLPRLLRAAGLTGIHADARFPVSAPAAADLQDATVRHVREAVVDAGLATDEEIDRHLADIASARLDLATSTVISAWGRRP